MFSEFPKEKLKEMLNWVLKYEDSDFYRNHLGMDKAVSELSSSIWEQLPLLSRRIMIDTPMWQRSFFPPQEVHFVRHTYGSSGNGILVTPRICFGDYSHSFYQGLNIKRVMNFFASAGNNFPYEQTGVYTSFGDVSNLKLSAEYIKKLKIDSVYLTPYTAMLLADELDKLEIIQGINTVQLTGERCSPAQYKALVERYRNALVFGNYSASETREFCAVPCRHKLGTEHSLSLTATPEWYIELVDPDTKEVITEPGRYGEIVMTTLAKTPMPFIRYATGDVAKYSTPVCECDVKNPAFTVQGRKDVLPIRMQRGEITIEAVSEALAALREVDARYFEIRYREERVGNKVLPRLVISVCTETQLVPLAHKLERLLRVYQNYSYHNGVMAGSYLPIKILKLTEVPKTPAGKTAQPRVIREIDSISGEQQEKTVT